MPRNSSLFLFLAALLVAAPLARSAPSPVPPTDEGRLIGEIHRADELEMQLGRMAARRSGDARVRRYGDRLERDQDEADSRLMRLALSRRIKVPEQGAAPAEAAAIETLRGLSGPEFDRQLTAALAAEQARTLNLLRAEMELTQDRETRRLLGILRPIFEEHRDLTRSLQRARA